jgi:plastocyanin
MKSWISRWSLIAAVLALLLCAPAVTRADTHIVIVESNDFSPFDITINQGDTVIWMWTRGVHTTTSMDGLWDSGILPAGSMFDYTFNDPGDYFYICTLHIECCGMAGVVRVNPRRGKTPVPVPPIDACPPLE